MKYTTVLWDFNGTIVDDVQLGIRAVNRMLIKRALPPIPDTGAYHRVFRFPVREYYRLLGFDFDKEPYEDLAVEWVQNYTAEEHTLTVQDGFFTVWQHLRDAGVQQIILSSSESAMLHRQMEILGLTGKFDRVLGMDDIYAGGKVEMAKRCVGDTGGRALLIGDTSHDADTARAIGADCILYTGGHGSAASLAACGVATVGRLKEVLPFL